MSGPIRPSIQLWLTASKRREREIPRGLKAAADAGGERQGHVRFGSASEMELSSSTSPARQRSANRPSFARSFRHSPALERSTWVGISAASFDS